MSKTNNMNTNIKIYRVSNIHDLDIHKQAYYFTSEEPLIDLVEKCVWLQFKSEELIHEEFGLENEQIGNLLQIIAKIESSQTKEILQHNDIDIYYEREKRCGDKYFQLMKKYSSELIENKLLEIKKEFYLKQKSVFIKRYGEKEGTAFFKKWSLN